jgi:hypothetical protein
MSTQTNSSASQETVDMDLSAEGVVTFSEVKLDDTNPLSVLLSLVQSDASMYQF